METKKVDVYCTVYIFYHHIDDYKYKASDFVFRILIFNMFRIESTQSNHYHRLSNSLYIIHIYLDNIFYFYQIYIKQKLFTGLE